MSTEGDLSDFDIHLIMEALSTRQSKEVASCALGIKLLLTEIQQQLLDLMVEGRLADTPVSHASGNAADESLLDSTDFFDEPIDEEIQINDDEGVGQGSTVAAESVMTGAVVPITGSLIKSPNPYPCSECQMVFSTKKALSRHLAKHDTISDDAGEVETFDRNGLQATETEPSDQPAQNASIENLFVVDTAELLKIKLPLPKPPGRTRSSSNHSSVRVTCTECGTQTLKQHMARHMLTHTGVKPFTCEKCDAAFNRKDKLKEHMRKHENGDDCRMMKKPRSKLSKCRKCDFETEDKELFKEHRKTHPSKMTYKCNDCAKEFHCPSHLEQHSIKHRNEKPYMCDMCGVSFSREPNLARHIRSHTSPAPYNCKYCNKPYHRNNELIVHERTHTGEKPYICEICGNGYASSKYLKRHLFTHTGLKPFKCDLCDRAFARPENMRAHRKLHEKPSNRLPPSTGDAVASTFHSSQLDAVVGDNTVDNDSSPQHSIADLYQFSSSNIPVSNDSAANRNSGSESIMQSFKISDEL